MDNKILNGKDIWSLIKNIDKPIYIAGHLKPDQDSFCSSMALCLVLNKIGKNAKVLLKSEDFSEFSWLNQYNVAENVVFDINENDYIFISLDLNEKKRLGNYEKYFDVAKTTFNIDHHQDNKYEADYTFSNPDLSRCLRFTQTPCRERPACRSVPFVVHFSERHIGRSLR